MPMPLSPPTERTMLHTRRIEIMGYGRPDGLYDVEAVLVDTKSYAFANHDRGTVEPGTPLHRMLARMTLSADMVITRFEADTEFSPYALCPQAAPNFERLAGLRVGRGFIKQANERIGGVHGCTHLRELLGQMGTVAFQTLYAKRERLGRAANAESTSEQAPAGRPSRPPMLNTCLAYASDSPVVQRSWPEHYTGS